MSEFTTRRTREGFPYVAYGKRVVYQMGTFAGMDRADWLAARLNESPLAAQAIVAEIMSRRGKAKALRRYARSIMEGYNA